MGGKGLPTQSKKNKQEQWTVAKRDWLAGRESAKASIWYRFGTGLEDISR
jgi:hypothetical protein